MTDKRLLHVIGESRYGGGSSVVLAICEAAVRSGWEADVLTTDPTLQSHLRERGLGVVDLPVIQRNINPMRDLADLVRVQRFVKDSAYDLVHTHTSKGGLIGRKAARLAKIPSIVHTVHGFAFHDRSSTFERRLYVGLERRAARWCDAITTVSQYHRDVALRNRIGNPEMIYAIPNGIDGDSARSTMTRREARQTLGLPTEGIIALGFGRLARQKGFSYLIQAVARRLARGEDPGLVLIAGTGEAEEELTALNRELGTEPHLRFLGFRLDLPELLAAVDYVVLPSLWEGLSIALLEAMAAERPVVTTSIPSNLEVLGDTESFIVVEPGTVEPLAEAMARLESNRPLQARLGAAARDRFEAAYDRDSMADAYVALYEKLHESAGHRRA